MSLWTRGHLGDVTVSAQCMKLLKQLGSVRHCTNSVRHTSLFVSHVQADATQSSHPGQLSPVLVS